MSQPWSWRKRNLEGGSEEESVVRREWVEVVARGGGSGRESVVRLEMRPFWMSLVGRGETKRIDGVECQVEMMLLD
jgi:hypothetical protein